MFKAVIYLLKAFYYLHLSKVSERKRILLSQYYRAIALPNWGFKIFKDSHIANKKIDVSVIITSFNYSSYIQACIKSVIRAAEHKSEIEIVVIDDASSDDSIIKILESIKNAPIPVLVMRSWWNVGVSRARNLAISRAHGKYVFILDADNSVSPKAIENLYALAYKASADAAYGIINRVNLDGSSDGVVSNTTFNHHYLLNNGNYIDAMALFHRQKLLNIGGFNVELLQFIGGWEDYALWLELAKHKFKVAFLKEEIGLYLVKTNSMVKKITTTEMIAFREYSKSHYPGFNALANLK